MPFLIPLAGLALGALGQLFRNNRSAAASSSANALASANTPSETSLSTAASGGGTSHIGGSALAAGSGRNATGPSGQTSSSRNRATNRFNNADLSNIQPSNRTTTPPIGRAEADALVDRFRRRSPSDSTQTGGDPVSAITPATGPVQQNSGGDSPTPAVGQDAGLGARLGAASIAASRKKNKDQQKKVSNAALS